MSNMNSYTKLKCVCVDFLILRVLPFDHPPNIHNISRKWKRESLKDLIYFNFNRPTFARFHSLPRNTIINKVARAHDYTTTTGRPTRHWHKHSTVDIASQETRISSHPPFFLPPIDTRSTRELICFQVFTCSLRSVSLRNCKKTT